MQRGNRCLFQRLENGIQEFIFVQSSHAAVDEFIDHLTWIAANDLVHQTESMSRILMDTRTSGALPMYYIAKRSNEWSRQQPRVIQSRPTRIAQLYKASSAYVTIARNLGKVFNNKHLRQEYFHDDHDAAIAWLLKDD